MSKPEYTVTDEGCWVTHRKPAPNGYVKQTIRVALGEYRWVHQHRHFYEKYVGPIPKGLELDHLCRNPLCCNPAHLEPVTHAENVRRGKAGENNRAKTCCPSGHPYNEANTRLNPRGNRECRICRNEGKRRRRLRRRQQG